MLLLADRQVPAPIVWAADLRWASETTLWIAAAKKGVFEVSVSNPEEPPRQLTPGSSVPGGFWLSSLLARSAKHLVIGAPVFSYFWALRSDLEQHNVAFDVIADFDVNADQLVILGGLKDEKQSFSPDGAIGWLGPIEKGREGLRPILYSAHGPGARAMGRCGLLGLGAARFMPDGSVVLIPGVEPGISWYSKDGELQRRWESSALSLEDECKPVLDNMGDLAIDPNVQNRWLAARRIVDEILPLPDGPGVIIREVKDEKAQWHMALLRADGSVSWLDLPFKGSTTWSHLKGDVMGTRIAFLIVEHGNTVEKPFAAPRLVIAELMP